MNKAVFLDRDGTINIEKNYLHKIDEFEYLPGAVEGLKRIYDKGYLLIIVTNQSGIARGYYSEEDFYRLNEWMISDLDTKGIKISKVYYCPHHPNASVARYRCDCNCRKPKTGMFWQAQKEFNIDFSESYAIGDKLRDLSICSETAVKGILIGKSEIRSENILACNNWNEIIRNCFCDK